MNKKDDDIMDDDLMQDDSQEDSDDYDDIAHKTNQRLSLQKR